MGEIADMMLEGELCFSCGEYLEVDEPVGFPSFCSRQCAKDADMPDGYVVKKQKHG